MDDPGEDRQKMADGLLQTIERRCCSLIVSTSRAEGRFERARPLTRTIVKLCTIIAATLALESSSVAQDNLPIVGTYRAGRPCRGDDMRSRAVLVTITAQQITHPGGVCTIDDKKQRGNTAVMRTTCKDSRGKVLSGEVSFVVRTDKILYMTALDGSYTAILNRCPEPPTSAQPEHRDEPAAAE
jgi:hypothetical protein